MATGRTDFFARIRKKNRISCVSSTDYREKWSYHISTLHLLSALGLYTIGLATVLFLLLKYTPLRYLISETLTAEHIHTIGENQSEISAIAATIRSRQLYLDDLRSVLSGQPFEENRSDTASTSPASSGKSNRFEKSREDSLLRVSVESEKSSAEFHGASSIAHGTISAPVTGIVSQSFDWKKMHLGVDVVTLKDAPIKSCLDGSVIFSGWAAESGYVIAIQHQADCISIYKHCSSLLKTAGEVVRHGDPIGIVGNTGKYTSGPHLHFELWKSGKPINPLEWINFNRN